MRTNLVAATVTPVWLHFGPNRVRTIEGYNPSGDLFLQLFDLPSPSNSPITTGAIPRESLQLQGTNSFKWDFNDGIDFSRDLSVAVSTTQASYTAPGAGAGANVSIIHDGPYPVLASSGAPYVVSDVGDYSTPIDHLQVWTEAAGATAGKILRRIDYRPNAALQKYLVGYAVDTPLASSKPLFIISIPASANGQDLQFHAGAGNPIFAQLADFTLKAGLTINIAATTVPGAVTAGTPGVMRAIYTDI